MMDPTVQPFYLSNLLKVYFFRRVLSGISIKIFVRHKIKSKYKYINIPVIFKIIIYDYNTVLEIVVFLKFFYEKLDLKMLKITFLEVTRRALSNHAKKSAKQILLKFSIVRTLLESDIRARAMMRKPKVSLVSVHFALEKRDIDTHNNTEKLAHVSQ